MWPLAGSGEKPGTYPTEGIVTFILTLYGTGAVRPVHLAGSSEVVRVEADTAGAFEIAIKCDAPINGFEAHLD